MSIKEQELCIEGAEISPHFVPEPKMTSGQQERRQAMRFAYDCEARCETPGRLSVDRITTLSSSGAWIEKLDPPAEGSTLNISFTAGSVYITAQAMVVHRVPGKGMGIAFYDLSPQHQEAIEALSADISRK